MNTTTTSGSRPRTLAEKVWEAHLVKKGEDGTPDLIYIDLHLVHEVTSPQAFEGLRLTGRTVRHPEKTLAVVDHNVPTSPDRKRLPARFFAAISGAMTCRLR